MQRQNRENEVFLPGIVSWNVTYRCNLRCAHCYLDAGTCGGHAELSTDEARLLIDQIADLGSPILVLSGGEPLLRNDILEIARYGHDRGLRMALGTNGTLIDDTLARSLRNAGIATAAISLDSADPAVHDRLRGVQGSWQRAVDGIRACLRAGIRVQLHTTVTPETCRGLDAVFGFGKGLGIRQFQVFFLVPTGRGRSVADVSPETYESLIRQILGTIAASDLAIRPTCAPQFMRIASEMGIRRDGWTRGCIAGRSYCRVTPEGSVTPCPYLPLDLGSIRNRPLAAIWHGSEVLQELRDPDRLRGACGRCEYRTVCGGCRARAYGLSGGTASCGGTGEPGGGDYLAEDPWCPYEPLAGGAGR